MKQKACANSVGAEMAAVKFKCDYCGKPVISLRLHPILNYAYPVCEYCLDNTYFPKGSNHLINDAKRIFYPEDDDYEKALASYIRRMLSK